MFKAKSIRSLVEPRKDGLRILATRGRGRCLPKDRYDIWMANLGPSEQLRNEFLAGKSRGPNTATDTARNCVRAARSIAATRESRIMARNSTLRLLQHLVQNQIVTLLCHCAEDEQHCHRHPLKTLLERKVN
jgi:uncharacterized protein YeaO (DUF488 family)